MLQLRGYNDGTPTHALHAALHRADPGVFTTGGDHIDLSVVPRRTDHIHGDRRPQAHANAWYDLIWTRPEDRTRPADELHTRGIARAGALPAPPVIPADQRLAATPPATLDQLSHAQITLLGGPDAALTTLESQRRLAVQSDRTVDIYDWDTYATRSLAVIRAAVQPAGASR